MSPEFWTTWAEAVIVFLSIFGGFFVFVLGLAVLFWLLIEGVPRIGRMVEIFLDRLIKDFEGKS